MKIRRTFIATLVSNGDQVAGMKDVELGLNVWINTSVYLFSMRKLPVLCLKLKIRSIPWLKL